MENSADEQIEEAETQEGWLIEIRDSDFGTMILGFQSEPDARVAYASLSAAFVLGESGILILQTRDENGNWLTIETAELK